MDLDRVLATLAADPAAPCDVAEIALWLARDEFLDLDVAACLAQLHEFADSTGSSTAASASRSRSRS